MKKLTCNLGLAMIGVLLLLSCGKSQTVESENLKPSIFSKPLSEALPSIPPASMPITLSDEDTVFSITSGDITLNAKADSSGKVTILNYPSEWRGRAILVKHEGESSFPLFSIKHCNVIKHMISLGQGALVRSVRSLVAFEMPFYLTSEFPNIAQKAATAAGISETIQILNLPMSHLLGSVELKLKEGSLAGLVGNMAPVVEELNISRKGDEDNLARRQIFVYSRDILCDLALQKAEIIMSYSIENEENVLKTIYETLTIDIKK